MHMHMYFQHRIHVKFEEVKYCSHLWRFGEEKIHCYHPCHFEEIKYC